MPEWRWFSEDVWNEVAWNELPDTSNATVDWSITLEECRVRCLANCSCMAYSSAHISSAGGSGCITWEGDLIDLRGFVDNGEDLYIRLAAPELDSEHENSAKNQTVIILIGIIAAVILLLGSSGCCILKKKSKRNGSSRAGYVRRKQLQLLFTSVSTEHCSDRENSRGNDLDLPLFPPQTLASATNNFSNSNKIGEGGFGAVYKGELREGKFIAVKRLSKSSLQGLEELKNEILVWQEHLEEMERTNVQRDSSAHEFAMNGIFSVKSDIFSFGVPVLEIISGEKNKATYYTDHQLNLLRYAWDLWKEGKSLQMLD